LKCIAASTRHLFGAFVVVVGLVVASLAQAQEAPGAAPPTLPDASREALPGAEQPQPTQPHVQAPAPAEPPAAPTPPATLADPNVAQPSPIEASAPEVVDVTVRAGTLGQRMEASSESVRVVELSTDRRRSADLGEVLARASGVGVRRDGGLGSEQKVSLGGLSDDQVRVFLDGLPLQFAGFGAGLANLPMGQLSRVEIYRGVVPIRFGADTLGGAINVVTLTPRRGTGGNAALSLGSFGTARASAGAHHLAARIGLLTRAHAFYDEAENDYPVTVTLPQPDGSSSKGKIYRRNDAYRAFGGGVDLGFVRRPWAERLMLKLFASGRRNELQSDLVMSIPYGEVRYGGENYGASLQYVQPLGEHVKVEALLGYGVQTQDFVDKGLYRYDWNGRRVRMLSRPGEIGPEPYDQTIVEQGAFARVQVAWQVASHSALNFNVSPSYTTRTGNDRAAGTGIDGLEADLRLLIVVSALEHVLELFDGRVENTLFGKSYLYLADATEPLDSGLWRSKDHRDHRFGVGDGLRVLLFDPLSLKFAYELATRLPGADEVFGDGARAKANLELRPEHSHNLNLSLLLDRAQTRAGSFSMQLHGFERRTQRQIVALGDQTFVSYQNVYAATARGLEAIGSYRSPARHVELDANVTYQAFRNVSGSAPYEMFKGDRIPNQPYFFANGSARLSWPQLVDELDEITFGYYLRYVHSFFRSWESGGQAGAKETVASQLSHTVTLTYTIQKAKKSYSFSLDCQNIGDAELYDNFGAQRPGRGYFAKMMAEF
jgi:vitamin B12 transporter